MFIGPAKMELSHETIVLALQEYFARRAGKGFVPKIKSVDRPYVSNGVSPFVVQMTEPETYPDDPDDKRGFSFTDAKMAPSLQDKIEE